MFLFLCWSFKKRSNAIRGFWFRELFSLLLPTANKRRQNYSKGSCLWIVLSPLSKQRTTPKQTREFFFDFGYFISSQNKKMKRSKRSVLFESCFFTSIKIKMKIAIGSFLFVRDWFSSTNQK